MDDRPDHRRTKQRAARRSAPQAQCVPPEPARGRPTGQLAGPVFQALVRGAVQLVGMPLRPGHFPHKVLLGLLETARQEVPGTRGVPSCELVALVKALSDGERTRIVTDVLQEPGPAKTLSGLCPRERQVLRSRLVNLPGNLSRAGALPQLSGATPTPGAPQLPGTLRSWNASDSSRQGDLVTGGSAGHSSGHMDRHRFPPAVLVTLIVFWALEGCCAGWLAGTVWGTPQGVLAGLVVFILFTAWTLGHSHPACGGSALSVLVLATIVVVFVLHALSSAPTPPTSPIP